MRSAGLMASEALSSASSSSKISSSSKAEGWSSAADQVRSAVGSRAEVGKGSKSSADQCMGVHHFSEASVAVVSVREWRDAASSGIRREE